MRGGTSKAIVFLEEDLPSDRAARDAIFLDAIGSPDPSGRQLDGMGGGISSLSKVCIVGPSTREDADVDYTFAQVSVSDAVVDYGSNCGNMSSAIGPFALDEGLVASSPQGEVVARIHNTNTGKIIRASFNVADGEAAVDGGFTLDGVSGAGAPIRLDFLSPGGSRTGKLLPTGSATCLLSVEGIGAVEASLIDAANPCVFVAAADLGKTGTETPSALEGDGDLLCRLEAIRRAASVAMGLASDTRAAASIVSVPKIAMVAAPQACRTLSGRTLAADDMDLLIRMISVGQPHRAVPITGALCVAVASRVPGSIPARHARAGDGPIRVGHASGVTVVDADVEAAEEPVARSAAVFRTARRLFEGHVCVRARALSNAGAGPIGDERQGKAAGWAA